MNTSIAKRRSYLSSVKKSGQRLTIGFAGIADFRSYIGQEYIAGVMKAAADYDINFINMAGAIKYSLFDDIDFISHYLKTFRFMKSPLIDGLVTWASSLSSFLDSDSIVSTFSALKPLPMVDIGYLDIPGVPSIRIDNSTSIHLLIQHLVNEHHYSRFAFFGSKISRPHETRLASYHQELKKMGIRELENTVYMAKTMDPLDIAVCVDQLCSCYNLKEKKELDVIITTSDIIAEALIEELDKRGIKVPVDIAVTGFNNQYNSISARSPVTTVNMEYYKRGYAAVELLIDQIMGNCSPEQHTLVCSSLIIRQSCGCFEKSIIESGNHESLFSSEDLGQCYSGDELRVMVQGQIKSIFSQLPDQELFCLTDCILQDIYDSSAQGILRWFQSYIQNERQKNPFNNSRFQQDITNLRRIIIPMVKDNEEQFIRMEDIFQQLRTLISIYVEYETQSLRNSTNHITNLSQIAISFASATNGKEIQEVLRYHLNKVEIPGIVLALSNNMSNHLSSAAIQMVWPEPPEDILTMLPFKIYDPACIPKKFFPSSRRYSMMLEILYHDNNYFGYAFLEMGSQNISLYDSMRLLLSNALFTVYTKEGRTRELSATINGDQLMGILNLSSDSIEEKNGITVKQITNYLIEHLNEMTNLDKMSRELMVSKSHLVRRCKELTGYTVQSLHERLKIEEAKNLLQIENLKLSEIASRLGFQNQNYFSNVFKKNTGLSPRAWCQRLR